MKTLVAAICTMVGTLVFIVLTATNNYEAKLQAQAQKIVKSYKDGYDAGAASVNTPRQCVDWWFGTDFKERHKQAQQAYCKGKK